MLENNPACSYHVYLKDREAKDTPERPKSDCGAPRSEQGSRANAEQQQQSRLQCKRTSTARLRAPGLADLCRMPEEPAFLAVPSDCGGNECSLTLSILPNCARAPLQSAVLSVCWYGSADDAG